VDELPANMKEIAFTPQYSSSGAKFSYSISGKVISVTDLKSGKGSFVEHIEKALRKITYWHQGSIAGFRILYRDTDGLGGEVRWDGAHAEILQPQ
jgi:hypothetical protein